MTNDEYDESMSYKLDDFGDDLNFPQNIRGVIQFISENTKSRDRHLAQEIAWLASYIRHFNVLEGDIPMPKISDDKAYDIACNIVLRKFAK